MWLYHPLKSLNSQPEPGCSASASSKDSAPSDSTAKLSVHVNGKLRQRPRSWRNWNTRKAAYRLFSTMRPAGLDDQPGEACADWNTWMRSRRVTHASRSAVRANVVEAAMLDTFGRRVVARLQDSNRPSCFSRTSMVTSVWGCGKSFGISNDSATALRQACSARMKSARRIFANGCSSSASWTTSNTGCGKESKESRSRRGSAGIDVQTQAKNWPTAASRDYKGDYSEQALTRQDGKSRENDALPQTATRWGMELMDQCDECGEVITPNHRCPCFRPREMTTDDGHSLLLAIWNQPSCPRLSPAFQWWLMGWPHPQIYFGSAATESSPSAPRGLSSTCSLASWNQWMTRLRSGLCSLVSSVESESFMEAA